MTVTVTAAATTSTHATRITAYPHIGMTNATPGIQTMNVPVSDVSNRTYRPVTVGDDFRKRAIVRHVIDNDFVAVVSHVCLQVQRDVPSGVTCVPSVPTSETPNTSKLSAMLAILSAAVV